MPAPSPLVLGVAAVGAVFVWSAVHGANVSATVKDLLAGRAGTAAMVDPGLTVGQAVGQATAQGGH